MDVSEYAVRWLEEVRRYRKPRTSETYAAIVAQHIVTALGPTPLLAVSRKQVKDWLLAKLDAGYSRGYVRLMLATLRRMLNAALYEDELIVRNPAAHLGHLVPRRKEARRAKALRRNPLEHLLDVIRAMHPSIGVLILVLGRVGLRIGEGLGLRWDDIDFDRHCVTIRRTLDWRRNPTDPKGNRERTVAVSDDALAALRALRGEGIPAVPWVFHGPSGRPWSRVHVRRVLHRACRSAGVLPISVHQLRHTFGTLLADRGVQITLIRDMLGHHSVTETEGYIDPLDGQREAVNRLDRR